jgi:hypothetical protein
MVYGFCAGVTRFADGVDDFGLIEAGLFFPAYRRDPASSSFRYRNLGQGLFAATGGV